jgi:hypothetical protein
MKPVETTKRLEAIKEKVKAKTMVEQAEREERPPLKLLERQILVNITLIRDLKHAAREPLKKLLKL